MADGSPVPSHTDPDTSHNALDCAQRGMSEAVELTGEPNAKVVAPAAADRQRIQSAGVGASSWAKLGSGSAGEHVKGCRCCFPPDQMFEDACQDIVGLGLPGIGSMQVLLCLWSLYVSVSCLPPPPPFARTLFHFFVSVSVSVSVFVSVSLSLSLSLCLSHPLSLPPSLPVEGGAKLCGWYVIVKIDSRVCMCACGVWVWQAEKFVRLCGGGVGSMTLSKGKFKTALKLRKGLPLTPQEVDDMQACVHRAYGPVLQQLGLGDI